MLAIGCAAVVNLQSLLHRIASKLAPTPTERTVGADSSAIGCAAVVNLRSLFRRIASKLAPTRGIATRVPFIRHMTSFHMPDKTRWGRMPPFSAKPLEDCHVQP